jgi:sugar-phosphatase
MVIRCEALLFDLDGVLVDSAECVEGTWRRWAEANGLDPDEVIKHAHGRRTIETVKHVAPDLAAEEEVARLAASESTLTTGIYQIAGAPELLAFLPGKWAIVTSGIRSVATLRIEHTGLPWPPVLICAEEISAGKPDPEGYLTAAHRLGVNPSDCVVVEDAPPGIEAARRAGMRSIAVLGTFPASALSRADAIVQSVASLGARSEDGAMAITFAPAAQRNR